MKVYEIADKVEVTWNAEVKANIDTWASYNVSLEEFREAVLLKGLPHAKANGGTAWVVDSSSAKGTFSQEIQEFIGSDIFPAFAKNGIKYFITIAAQASAMTQMTVKSFSAKSGPHGLQLVELNNVADAITWLRANA